MYKFPRTLAMGAVMLALFQGAAQAADTRLEAVHQELQALYDEFGGVDEALEATHHDFELRTVLCSYCHGSNGHSRNREVPSLAGQHAEYILLQLMDFASGERKLKVMHDLAEGMEPRDGAIIALHFSHMPPDQPEVDPVLAQSGAEIYVQHCVACHGVDGRGSGLAYARISGQQPDYLYKRLAAFNAAPEEGEAMHAMTRKLNSLELKALAHYAANLK